LSKLAQQWFYLARKDLTQAEFLWSYQDKESCKELVAFLCQQTAEKSMKCLLQSLQIRFNKTHDLSSIAVPLLKLYPEIETLLSESVDLTDYAVTFRYPDAQNQDLTIEDTQSALDLAKKINTEMSSRAKAKG
jgi:HEPN domain-containing protein